MHRSESGMSSLGKVDAYFRQRGVAVVVSSCITLRLEEDESVNITCSRCANGTTIGTRLSRWAKRLVRGLSRGKRIMGNN